MRLGRGNGVGWWWCVCGGGGGGGEGGSCGLEMRMGNWAGGWRRGMAMAVEECLFCTKEHKFQIKKIFILTGKSIFYRKMELTVFY